MVREIVSALLLLALLAGSVLNARHIEKLTDEIVQQLRLSEEELSRGDAERAKERIKSCFRSWLDAGDYTGALMRHEEIDDVADAFCDLLEALPEEDAEIIGSEYAWLYYCLDAVGEREQLSVRSIF